MNQTTPSDIHVAFPPGRDRHIKISVAACHLVIESCDDADWVTGTYQDPNGVLPLRVMQEGGTLRIEQEYNLARMVNLVRGAPSLDLRLGRAQPYMITLETGASDTNLELGGLPLTQVTIRQGAGKCEVEFSVPNLEEMRLLEISAGAASIEMKQLANTNAAVMTLQGGAAAYEFDFEGTLQRDAHVKIATGVSSVEVSVPKATAAKLAVESFLGTVDAGEGFTEKDGAFWTPAGLEGGAPMIIIDTNVALGSVKLRTT